MKINNIFRFPKITIRNSESHMTKDNILKLYKKYLYRIYNSNQNAKQRLPSAKKLSLNINKINNTNTLNTSPSLRGSITKSNKIKKKLKLCSNTFGKTCSTDCFNNFDRSNSNSNWRYSYKLKKSNLKSNIQINSMSQKFLSNIDFSELKSKTNRFAVSPNKDNNKQSSLCLVPSLLKSPQRINTIKTNSNISENKKNNKTLSSRKNRESITFSNNNTFLYHKLINDMSPRYRFKNFKMQLLQKTSNNSKFLLKYDKKILADKIILVDVYKKKENKKNLKKVKQKIENNTIIE